MHANFNKITRFKLIGVSKYFNPSKFLIFFEYFDHSKKLS